MHRLIMLSVVAAATFTVHAAGAETLIVASRSVADEKAVFATVESIRGVKMMYECSVAMRMKDCSAQDLLPYSQVVVSGIGALVNFEKSGYLSITP